MADDTEDFNAWNPGLNSEIPGHLMPMVTLYRPDASTVSYDEAKQAAEFCGRKPMEMNAFTARRLVRHELLIRLMADINVPDGPEYPELGEHLRSMAQTILEGYIAPKMATLEQEFERLRERISKRLAARLEQDVYARSDGGEGKTEGLLARLGLQKPKPGEAPEAPEIQAQPSRAAH